MLRAYFLKHGGIDRKSQYCADEKNRGDVNPGFGGILGLKAFPEHIDVLLNLGREALVAGGAVAGVVGCVYLFGRFTVEDIQCSPAGSLLVLTENDASKAGVAFTSTVTSLTYS